MASYITLKKNSDLDSHTEFTKGGSGYGSYFRKIWIQISILILKMRIRLRIHLCKKYGSGHTSKKRIKKRRCPALEKLPIRTRIPPLQKHVSDLHMKKKTRIGQFKNCRSGSESPITIQPFSPFYLKNDISNRDYAQ